MSELSELEARIRTLEDIEAIKKVKTRYWRSIDKKLWDELADCFTEDTIFEIPSTIEIQPKSIKLQGREAVVQYLKERMDTSSIITVHQGHQPDIEITSETTARAVWALNDRIFNSQANATYRGLGYYDDEYIKENGQWKISSTLITRSFKEVWQGQR